MLSSPAPVGPKSIMGATPITAAPALSLPAAFVSPAAVNAAAPTAVSVEAAVVVPVSAAAAELMNSGPAAAASPAAAPNDSPTRESAASRRAQVVLSNGIAALGGMNESPAFQNPEQIEEDEIARRRTDAVSGLSKVYENIRFESAEVELAAGKPPAWKLVFWGKRRSRWSLLAPFTRLTVVQGPGGDHVAEGETVRSPQMTMGHDIQLSLPQAIARMGIYYPDLKIDGVRLGAKIVRWHQPAMMSMDPGEDFEKLVPTYFIKAHSTANPDVTVVQELAADTDFGALNLNAVQVSGAADSDKGTAWAVLTLYADMGDFLSAASTKRPLASMLDERRRALFRRFGVDWASPEVDTLKIPHQSGGDIGRYFQFRIKLPIAQYRQLEKELYSLKAFVSLNYVVPNPISAARR
jgi:hypothetical protein